MEQELQIKAYRLNHDFWIYYSGYKYSKGRIFIQWWSPKHGNVTQMLASPTEEHGWGGGYSNLLDEMKKRSMIEEIELKELNKIKSHWNKQFYEILKRFNLQISEDETTNVQ